MEGRRGRERKRREERCNFGLFGVVYQHLRQQFEGHVCTDVLEVVPFGVVDGCIGILLVMYKLVLLISQQQLAPFFACSPSMPSSSQKTDCKLVSSARPYRAICNPQTKMALQSMSVGPRKFQVQFNNSQKNDDLSTVSISCARI